MDKYKLLQQRRRRMSVVAPISDKDNALDFQERIAICKLTDPSVSFSLSHFLVLVDSDFRNGLFKLTAMLIRNIDDSGAKFISKQFNVSLIDFVISDENEHEFRFAAIGGAPNGVNPLKGQSMFFFFFFFSSSID